jgi:HAD superfamily hydrolase (TIGR01509 family)
VSGAGRPGVLVDLDGTLVDTNYLHTLAWARAFVDVGEWAPMNAIHHLIGMGSDQLVEALLGHASPPAIEARHRRYRELMDEARVFPGAREALAAWHDGGLAVVIASSSPRDELEAMLDLLDSSDVIDAVTSADDVDRSKPHPDVFAAALRAGAVDPARAVVVGDSVWDVHAADRTGIPSIAVESGGTCAADLRTAGASRVYPSVAAMRDELSAAAITALHTSATGEPVAHRTGAAQAAVNRALDPPA